MFTSQGCSSCPPADAMLGELAQQPNVIALAYHVDYWDSLGWRDRYAVPAAAARQRQYVKALRLTSAFTPQLVIDGAASFVGSDRRILGALAQAPALMDIALDVSADALTVKLPAAGRSGAYEVNLITYLPEATTAVGRGENAGRSLKEYNIVRSFRRLGSWTGHADVLRVPLASLPGDATRAVVLLQHGEDGPIEGAGSAAIR